MLPPAQLQKVMLLGGGGIGDSQISTKRTAIADLSGDTPTYTPGPDLKTRARYVNAVTLPDDTVLAFGGSEGYRTGNNHDALIYHPDTNTFTDAARPYVGRNYHSAAVLLPDGRVAAFGSNPIDNSFEARVEIYSPAYLFKGARPQLTAGPTQLQLGGTHNFILNDSAGGIKTVRLIRPSAVTHMTDTEQRSVAADFTIAGNALNVTLPANHNLMPRGWYMMYVIDANGVPSVAKWVQVQ
jgi:hypothetical protein